MGEAATEWGWQRIALMICSIIIVILGILQLFGGGVVGVIYGILTIILGFFGCFGAFKADARFLTWFYIGCIVWIVIAVVFLILNIFCVDGFGCFGDNVSGGISAIFMILFLAFSAWLAHGLKAV